MEQVHLSLQRRIDDLKIVVDDNLAKSIRMSLILWYLCHLAAFIGFVSGFSIVGTAIANTEVGRAFNIMLGIASAAYPVCKYFDLEDKKKDWNTLALFCVEIKDNLDETGSKLKLILDDGYDPVKEVEEINKIVSYIGSLRITMFKLSIGDESFGKILDEFEEEGSHVYRYTCDSYDCKISSDYHVSPTSETPNEVAPPDVDISI